MEDETTKLKEEIVVLKDEVLKLRHDVERGWKAGRSAAKEHIMETNETMKEHDTMFEMVRRFRAAPPPLDNLPKYLNSLNGSEIMP